MINILDSKVVINEIERVRNAKKDFEERDVEYDISLLKKSLVKINKLINCTENIVWIDSDMWEECHNSLDNIVEFYNLKYGEVDEDNFKFSITR